MFEGAGSGVALMIFIDFEVRLREEHHPEAARGQSRWGACHGDDFLGITPVHEFKPGACRSDRLPLLMRRRKFPVPELGLGVFLRKVMAGVSYIPHWIIAA